MHRVTRQSTAPPPSVASAVQLRRRAETRRFGLPVWQILASGLVGVGLVARWYEQNRPEQWRPPSRYHRRLEPGALVSEQADVEALLSEVRDPEHDRPAKTRAVGSGGVGSARAVSRVHVARFFAYFPVRFMEHGRGVMSAGANELMSGLMPRIE